VKGSKKQKQGGKKTQTSMPDNWVKEEAKRVTPEGGAKKISGSHKGTESKMKFGGGDRIPQQKTPNLQTGKKGEGVKKRTHMSEKKGWKKKKKLLKRSSVKKGWSLMRVK